MLFVPSVEGISHNEAEFTHDDDALRGVELLTEVTRRLVRGELAEK
jgi:N-carbamoyl-L-amino-acid hydrolase